MRYFIILASFCLLLTSSCDEDSFNQVVDIPLPEHDPLPALTVDLRTGDTAIHHLLVLSRGILDSPTSQLRDMEIEVYKNESLLAERQFQVSFSEEINRPLVLQQPISDESATYRVVATVEGFDPVEAIQVMPGKPVFTLVNYEPDGAIDSEGYRVDEIEIDLTDDPDTEDYYGFRALQTSRDCEFDADRDTLICVRTFDYIHEIYQESSDPLMSMSSGYGMVISDQSFNGDTYRIRFLIDNYADIAPLLEVYRLTEDAYRYGLSRQAYEDSEDNPFAEPVNVHQNVINGYGYFIASNRVRLDLE